MDIKKFNPYLESKDSNRNSSDISLSDDIKDKNFEIEDGKATKIEDFEIEGIIDVFIDKPKDINESTIGLHADLSVKSVKRGDTIWITALLRKKGASITSPAVQGVLKVRVVDLYYGLQYLNKVINQ